MPPPYKCSGGGNARGGLYLCSLCCCASGAGFSALPHKRDFPRQHRADWRGVEPIMALFAAKLVQRLRQQNIPVFVHNAYRTPGEQYRLYTAGRSRNPGPVAPHTNGAAFDLVHSVYGWDLTPQEWLFLGRTAGIEAKRLGLSIEWGGNWGADWPKGKPGWDPAHYQLSAWRLAGVDPQTLPPEPRHRTATALIKEIGPITTPKQYKASQHDS